MHKKGEAILEGGEVANIGIICIVENICKQSITNYRTNYASLKEYLTIPENNAELEQVELAVEIIPILNDMHATRMDDIMDLLHNWPIHPDYQEAGHNFILDNAADVNAILD